MATYYVGPGGNDGNNGLTWALRKLTLNGAEDVPVVADDLVYVGPGVYRETLVVDVSGGAGTEIVYVADVSGEHTDGIGGKVRVTGSNDDTTTARANCIDADAKDYRIFRGFDFDMTSAHIIDVSGSPTDWTIEDCTFIHADNETIRIAGDAQADWIIRRCYFCGNLPGNYAIQFTSVAGIQDAGHLVQNCNFLVSRGMESAEVGGIDFRNCLVFGSYYGIRMSASPPGGFTAINVNNCIFIACSTALRAVVLGEIVENYNTFVENTTDRNTVDVGANSETYPPLFLPPLLHAGASQVSGFKFPWWFSELSEHSAIRAITGSNEPSIDMRGIPRPVTASKNSWGPCQFVDMELESGTVQAGTYSRVLHDAGQVLVRRVPVTGVEITVTLYMRREANYAGNLPQMVIKQPGQADQTTVMVAAVNTWEELSDTFTPASPPGFIEVWAESLNTAVAGNYEVFYDTMAVS